MKLEIGMYVRTKRGLIGQIVRINKDSVAIEFNKMWQDQIRLENIIKASFNIIDLIKEGDYVNGKEVYSIGLAKAIYNIINFKDGTFIINYDEVKSIVTKEQFEKLKYKVGD